MAEPSSQIDAILCGAVEMPSPEERAAFLAQHCGHDEALLQRVEQLLDAHFRAGSFLSSPTVMPAPTVDMARPEKPGETIGPYKLLEQIGEGGFGVVYMAEQEKPVRRRVALKIIKAGMDTRQVIARFEAERQALALMDHPNIARVLDAGMVPSGRPYFVMELVKGVPITEYCDSQKLSVRQRLDLMRSVCHGVQHAHQKGVIHRDLKPSNVLVAEFDGHPVPRIIDFGVAKAIGQPLAEKTLFTQFGQIIGTLEYMSPEQARFNQLDVDTRSDVYSLGVLLYELLAGSTPLEPARLRTAAFDQILKMISDEEPPRPSVRLGSSQSRPSIAAHRGLDPKRLAGMLSGDLDWIVMKALEKERGRRYETASALAQDLEHYLADEPVTARPPSATYRFRKFARRNKGPLAAAAVLATALVGGLGVSTWLYAKEKVARQRAVAAEAEASAAATKSAKLVTLLTEMLAGDGRATKAPPDVALLEEVLAFAGDQSNAAMSLNNFGMALRDRGAFAHAELLHRRSIALLEESRRDEIDFLVRARNNLALVLWDQGKWDEAHQTFRQAMSLGLRIWEPDDYRMATLYNNLGAALATASQPDKARELLDKALVIRQRDLGVAAVETGETLYHLACLAYDQGDVPEAVRRLRQLLQTFRDNPVADPRHLAAVLMQLSIALTADGQAAEAEGFAREAVAVCDENIPDYWGGYAMRSVLGGSLLGQERFDEALPLLMEGYDGMQDRWELIPVHGRHYVRDAVERLVRCFEAMNRPDDAEHWKQVLAEFDQRGDVPPAASSPGGKRAQ